MSSTVLAGHLIISSAKAIRRLYRNLRPFKVGIYGPSLTGKTTLDQYLTVPGDIEPIPLEFRTSHALENGKYHLPKPHRKQIKWKRERHPISSADVGGQTQFKNLWIEDMFGRQVNVVFFMIDERVLTHPQFTMEAIASMTYLVDNITGDNRTTEISRKAKKHARKGYMPDVFCLLINKMDLWWSPQAHYLWANGLQREHPIVYPFRQQLRRLRKAGIQAKVEAMSAQHGLHVEKVMINMIEAI
tara:strand:- start:1403 stop:2134 length:732 start_codon:yes stop_codon:yes gene_type:complete